MVMHLQVRFSAPLLALTALALCAGTSALSQSTASPTAGNGTYIAGDPLANVRYDNRFDVSLGMAYDHMKAGPNVLQGANLGGLDLSASYWLSKHWAVEGSGRYYLGTSGVGQQNDQGEKGPFVDEIIFTGGPEWLGPHNKHGALIAHVLVGGAHFNSHVWPLTAETANFYNDQIAPAAIIGGHIDLNRSAHWVFRVAPDAVMTHYGINYGSKISQFDVNFAISVGVEYKFKKKR
jgi:hypothetical protein